MIFKSSQLIQDTAIDSNQEYVQANTVTELVEEIVQNEIAFEHDFLGGQLVTKEEAEHIVIALKLICDGIKERRNA